MARIGLKLYFLRTRERQLSQQQAADGLGVRQATLSHLEQGLSQPNFDLLGRLCRFYDVTPTFLIDEARSIRPRPTERWTTRDALVTVGMWIETPIAAIEDVGSENALCPLAPRQRFYDAEAADIRRRFRRPNRADAALDDHQTALDATDVALEGEMEAELREHPRRRGRVARVD